MKTLIIAMALVKTVALLLVLASVSTTPAAADPEPRCLTGDCSA
jgi:hypothetical protein